MEQRDWGLLDKQMRGLSPPRNETIMVLTVVAVFLAGVILGGLLVPQESGLMELTKGQVVRSPKNCHQILCVAPQLRPPSVFNQP